MTDAELAKIRADYEAARTMREVSAAKRINFEDYGEGLHGDRWFVAKGKSTDCFGEGTANHWRWAAMILLGLASPDDAPHAEDKPTPEIVPMLIAEVERLRADAARLDWIDRADGPQLDLLVDELGRGRSRAEIDRVAGEEATWLAK